MPIQKTLVVIKPDMVIRGLVAKIESRYKAIGLEILSEKYVTLSYKQACDLYFMHAREPYFVGWALSVSRAKCKALILQGENAINVVMILNGPHNCCDALPGQIRYDFQSAGGPFNCVDSSDSVEAFERESKIFFLDEVNFSLNKQYS